MTRDTDRTEIEASAQLDDADPQGVTTTTSRRTFLKGAAVGATACAVGVSSTGTVAAAPWEDYTVKDAAKDALLATSPAAYGVDYLMGTDYVDEAQTRIANYAHRRYGDMRDYSGYTGHDALLTEIETGMKEMQLANEKVMTSVGNNIQAADNVAIAKGQVAVAEALNAGKSESEAQNDMEAVIDEYFSKIEENIINHWNTQWDQVCHMALENYEHPDSPDPKNRWKCTETSSDGGHWVIGDNLYGDNYHTVQYELYDGRVLDVHGLARYNSTSNADSYVFPSQKIARLQDSNVSNPEEIWLMQDTSSTQEADAYEYVMDPTAFGTHFDKVQTTRDDVHAELTGYVTDVYGSYEAGEVDVSEVVDPTTYATEMSTDNNRGFRQAAAAQLGIPTNADENVVITIHWPDQEDSTIWTDLYTDHQPTDANGNAVPWQVGTTYSPSSWTEPLFIVFEDDEGNSEMSQLEEDFTVEEAYDQDGVEIEEFDNEQTTTHTSDVNKLQEELDQLQEEQVRLIEKFQDEGGPAGGTTSSGGGPPGFVSWLSDDSIARGLGADGVPNAVPATGGIAGLYAFLAGGT